jgi:hypothetical protein
MSTPEKNYAAFIKALTQLIAGLQNSMPPGLTQLAAGGTVSTLAALVTELQAILAVYQAAEDAAATHAKAILARDELAPTAIPRVEAIRFAVKGAFGKKSPDLPKVGMAPDKTPPTPTVAQKEQRVAKGKATRVARGTLGPKQKAAIHGQVATPAPASPTVPVTPAVVKGS